MSTRTYIVSRGYDWTLFLMPPAWALCIGMLISGSSFSESVFELAGLEITGAELFMSTIVHAHLVAVLFRSHGNPDIFRLYPRRFIAVPLILWAAIALSPWVAVTATVVATFWDVWHSGAQTFGFARIYERNHGTDPQLGRSLDFWLNQLLYAGPILAGATLMGHVDAFYDYEELGVTLFSAIPAHAGEAQRVLTWVVVVGGTAFVAYYAYSYWRFYQKGYRFSLVKVYLLASTGLCSIYTWGFNSWGEAFFIMNLFHAVQYLALVWAVEKRQIQGRLGLGGHPRGKPLALVAYLGSVFAYGVGVALLDQDITVLWAATLVISLMHFWYDAFIWSVAKKQI